MTLDEAIRHAEKVAAEKRSEYQKCVAVHDMENAVECAKCGEEQEQLANWLKDYKRLLNRSEQQWIPCRKRLPDEKINRNTRDFEKVLCTTTFGDVRTYKFGAQKGWKVPHFWNGSEKIDECVIAWMPLPKPYEGD